jgi:hypothetical protein
MNKELYEKIKDRKAYYLFNDLEIQLSMITPDGAVIHKLGGIRQSFSSRVKLYRDNYWAQEETMLQYNERDNSDFELVMNKISDAVIYFQVKI